MAFRSYLSNLALAALLTLSSQVPSYGEEISREQVAAAAILTVADWAQTRYIAKNPNDYRELNPILGSHPSVGKVNIYFSTVLLLGALGISTGYINREFLYFYVGIEGSTVVRNYQVGVRFQF